MWQRFTERARKVIFYAQEEAQAAKMGEVNTEHLLIGLLRDQDTIASRVLEKMGANAQALRAAVHKQMPTGAVEHSQDMTLKPRAKRVIDLAYDEARNLNNNYIGTEHLFLGLIREGDGVAGRVLARHGIELEKARREVMEMQDVTPHDPPPPVRPQAAWAPIRSEGYLPLLLGNCLSRHLVLCLSAQEDSLLMRAMRAEGVEVRQLRDRVRALLDEAAEDGLRPEAPEDFGRILALAREESSQQPITVDHLLLAILQSSDQRLIGVLEELGITTAKCRALMPKEEG